MASKLRNSTRRILEPAMAELGFRVRYPHFQRTRNGELELVSLHHDKWGGGFCLEFAKHAAGDLETSWGEVVPEDKIDVAYTNPATRARLFATLAHSDQLLNFFRYEDIADDRAGLDDLVEQLVRLLPQVIEWFETRAVGPNVQPFGDPPVDPSA